MATEWGNEIGDGGMDKVDDVVSLRLFNSLIVILGC
jgi:hypothetical protein